MPEPLAYLPQLPRDKSVPIGCVGSGFIMADCHLVAYRAAGFNPIAIASANPAKARAIARRHAIHAVYETYQEMLDRSEAEVIDVAVPPDLQLGVIREIVKRARVRGILAQKPLGMNLSEAVEVVRLCRAAGITLVVNQNMRYDQSVRACRSLPEPAGPWRSRRAGAGHYRHACDPALDALARTTRLGHATHHVDPSPGCLPLSLR